MTTETEILRAKTSVRDATDCLIQAVGHTEAEQIIQQMIINEDRPDERLYTALSHVRMRQHQESERVEARVI